ncbi:MAG TPA: penicillin-binding protein 2, partial [Thermopetrobacter sp.]|nr:penicillin-binding protein 2 [Thermopetrobacter sp.]
NRVRLSPIPPTRGLIYDRRGVLLADNLPAFNLEIVPEQVKDLPNLLGRLGEVIELSEDDIQRFERLRRRSPAYRSLPIKTNLSEAEVARFMVARHRFDGVSVQARLQRHYPFGARFAHLLGYVGRINERELRRVDARNYRATTHIGKTGIEKYYESLLHGTVGVREDEVNSHGRRIRVIRETPPRPGESLVLSVDARLQAVATAALAGRSGAVVALDPRNGEVLALVSEPDFDPNLFVNGISRRDYARLRDDRERPLFNRALRGQYPPGSTVKPIVALAGLEAGLITPERRMFAGPYYELPGGGRRFRDWLKGGHGWVDLDRAIVRSCDVYFYDLSYKLGIDRLHDIYGRFGLGRPTGVDLPGELGGLLPSREWKRRRHKQAWYPGETVILGIGQGYLLATPLQLATMTACIAMRGDCPQPHLLKARIPGSAATERLGGNRIELKDPTHWDVIIDAMKKVITDPKGTGRRIAEGLKWPVAAKTGTSQVFGLKEGQQYDAETLERHLRDHALFVAFAPADAPRIAIAVVVEHGGHGGVTAAPIGRKIIDAWLENH